jgi:hypothetical protein
MIQSAKKGWTAGLTFRPRTNGYQQQGEEVLR